MSDDLVARLCSPEEIVFPAGTKITLDNGKTMELLEPFSMWSSSSDKQDAAAEIVLLRAEITRYRAGLQKIVNADGWWDAPSLARDLLEGKEIL